MPREGDVGGRDETRVVKLYAVGLFGFEDEHSYGI